MPAEVNEESMEPVVAPEKEAEKPDTVTMSRAEADALRRDRDEARESERYWSTVARGGARPPEQVEEPAEHFDGAEFVDPAALDGIEGDTPEKLVDEFAAKGVSALKARGFITAADAQKLAVEVAARVSREMISRERQKIGTDTQIISEFPELKDQNSELFRQTAIRYQKAVAMDPNAKKTPAALYLAADAARSFLQSQAPTRHREDNGYEPEPENDRRRRAESQDSRPRRGQVEEADDDMLGAEAKSIIKSMGITEAEFKASQKSLGQRPRNGRR